MFSVLLKYLFVVFFTANAYIYEMEGPSFSERWMYWVSRTPEQRLWSCVKNEIEKLFKQAHFAVNITLHSKKKLLNHSSYLYHDVKTLIFYFIFYSYLFCFILILIYLLTCKFT